MRKDIEKRGYDRKRGIFVRSYGSKDLDAALLLLPAVDFVAWDDERMVRTTNAIRKDLSRDGLVLRYKATDGLPGKEGSECQRDGQPIDVRVGREIQPHQR